MSTIGNVGQVGVGRRSGIARGDEHFGDARRLRDLPRERVLATAAAYDQYLHRRALFIDVGALEGSQKRREQPRVPHLPSKGPQRVPRQYSQYGEGRARTRGRHLGKR